MWQKRNGFSGRLLATRTTIKSSRALSSKDQGKIGDTPYKNERRGLHSAPRPLCPTQGQISDLRCAAYNSPNCKDQEALCGFDSGCDRELWKWTSETRLQLATKSFASPGSSWMGTAQELQRVRGLDASRMPLLLDALAK